MLPWPQSWGRERRKGEEEEEEEEEEGGGEVAGGRLADQPTDRPTVGTTYAVRPSASVGLSCIATTVALDHANREGRTDACVLCQLAGTRRDVLY